MLVFRWLILLALLATAVSFVLFAATSQPRFKRFGLQVLFGTLAAAFVFFAVLAFQSFN